MKEVISVELADHDVPGSHHVWHCVARSSRRPSGAIKSRRADGSILTVSEHCPRHRHPRPRGERQPDGSRRRRRHELATREVSGWGSLSETPFRRSTRARPRRESVRTPFPFETASRVPPIGTSVAPNSSDGSAAVEWSVGLHRLACASLRRQRLTEPRPHGTSRMVGNERVPRDVGHLAVRDTLL
jgi:hypothetical protein